MQGNAIQNSAIQDYNERQYKIIQCKSMQCKIRFPFVARSENSWPLDKFKVYANIVFQVIFQN